MSRSAHPEYPCSRVRPARLLGPPGSQPIYIALNLQIELDEWDD